MTGNEIKSIRTGLGLSLNQFADCLGIGRRTVERMQSEGCTLAMARAIQHLRAEHAGDLPAAYHMEALNER